MLERTFTSLNHPEPDEDGVQRYSVSEIIKDADAPGGHYDKPVADNLTWEEVQEYIAQNGEPEDA